MASDVVVCDFTICDIYPVNGLGVLSKGSPCVGVIVMSLLILIFDFYMQPCGAQLHVLISICIHHSQPTAVKMSSKQRYHMNLLLTENRCTTEAYI